MYLIFTHSENNDDDIKNSFYDRLEWVYDIIFTYIIEIIVRDISVKVGNKAIYRPTNGKQSLR